MEIQLYKNTAALAEIPKADHEIGLALTGRLFSNIPDVEAFNIIRDAILKGYISAKYSKIEASELDIITDETMKCVKNKFGSLRENEFIIALMRGLLGDYGEFHGISFISCSQFVKSYLKEPSRVKLTLPPKQEAAKPSDDEIHQLSKQNALEALKELNKTGTVGRFGVIVYDFFENIGLINLSLDEKKEYWQQAKEEYEFYLKTAISVPLDLAERKKTQRDLDDFMQGGKQDRLKVISKRLAVDDYLRSLTMEGADLNTLI